MDLADLDYLQSAVGQRWLAEVSRKPLDERNHLSWASKLRKEMTAAEAHAVLETALLRQRGARKFSNSAEMYFDRAGLEMSSAEIISTHRARRYAPFAHVADLCCGIGGDAIGLTQHSSVTAIDRDPLRLAMAALNVAAYADSKPFTPLEADLTTLDPIACDALFFDPARRDERGKRIYSIAKYRPSVSILER